MYQISNRHSDVQQDRNCWSYMYESDAWPHNGSGCGFNYYPGQPASCGHLVLPHHADCLHGNVYCIKIDYLRVFQKLYIWSL